MKKLKQILALALCGAMVLAGTACGAQDTSDGGNSLTPTGSQGGDGQSGRYVETDITPPGAEGEHLKSFAGADGTLTCYTQDLTKRFDSADGGDTWQESEGPAAKNPQLGEAQTFTLLPDGSLLAAMTGEDGMGINGLMRIAPDGTAEPFALPKLDEVIASEKMVYLNALQALSDDRLLLGYSAGDFGYGSMTTDDTGEGEDGGEDGATGLPEAGTPEAGGPEESTPEAGTPEEGADPAADDTDDGGEGDGEEEPASDNMSFGVGMQENFAGLIDLTDGKVLAEYTEWYGTSAAVSGDRFYLLDHTGEVQGKSLADGSASGADATIPVDEFAFNLAMGAAPGGGLYVISGRQVQKLAENGTTETVLDGSGYAFADPGAMVSTLHAPENGDILLDISSQNGSRLLRYRWDENASVDPDKVLKVWSLKESALLRTAISVFRKAHPEALVEYEVALSGDGGMTAEDAIKNLNTRLLGGDGPDVMLLDGCPAASYASRGMLLNLKDLVDASSIFPALLNAYETDDGTFTLPLGFKVPLLLGTEENLAKLDSLKKLAEAVQAGADPVSPGNGDDMFANLPEDQRPVLAPEDLLEMFELLWSTSAPAVVGQNGLDTDAARELLATLLAISDKYQLGSEQGGTATGAIAVMSADGSAAASLKGGPVAYAMNRALAGGYLAEDMQMLQFASEPPDTRYISFPGLSDGTFIPMALAAISADTTKTDLAAAFLQTMLSNEVQGLRSGAGFPVTASGMQTQMDNIIELMSQQRDEDYSFEFDYNALLALAKQPTTTDETLTDMVWTVAQSLCAGETDLEGAVKQLEQDLKNYLAERQ